MMETRRLQRLNRGYLLAMLLMGIVGLLLGCTGSAMPAQPDPSAVRQPAEGEDLHPSHFSLHPSEVCLAGMRPGGRGMRMNLPPRVRIGTS